MYQISLKIILKIRINRMNFKVVVLPEDKLKRTCASYEGSISCFVEVIYK